MHLELSQKKFLVTGANGWLGIQLVKSLLSKVSQDAQIKCLVLPGQDISALKNLSPRISIVEGDLRNLQDCENFCKDADQAVVFHTAGIIHPGSVSDFYKVNLQGTKNLLTAATHSHVQRAVIVSSNSPCGCNPHPDHQFDEQSPYHPYMNYGRSKMLMELAIQEEFQKGKLETVIIRAPWFYGPGQPPRQSLFFKMIRQGKMPIVGSGKNLRSMAYLENLCDGLILAAAKAKANGETYWIADERPYSMNEIVDTIENLLEKDFSLSVAHKRVHLPGMTSEIALAVDWTLQKVGLYHQKIHVLSEMNKTIACSVRKAQQDLGYAPAVSLEEGMRRSIRWCLENGHDI